MEERLTVPGQGGMRKWIIGVYVVDLCIFFGVIAEIVKATLLLILFGSPVTFSGSFQNPIIRPPYHCSSVRRVAILSKLGMTRHCAA